MQKILLIAAVGVGLLLAYIDSRPTWDDTGIIAGAMLIVCGLLGAAEPDWPWLWALAVGVWIPLWHITTSGNYQSAIALVFAFAGAYAGSAGRRMLAPE